VATFFLKENEHLINTSIVDYSSVEKSPQRMKEEEKMPKWMS
jgi:hypothetical protein